MNLLTDREYLGLTVPFMLSTMTQPLMGAVNTAVMGQLPDPKYIAAVSLGAILFNNLYWLFGFLRVSTTGYAAQALVLMCLCHVPQDAGVHPNRSTRGHDRS